MTNSVNGQVATPEQAEQQKSSDKELNFARLRQERDRASQIALEKEREAQALAQEVLQLKSRLNADEDVDESSEPYVDHKNLNKKLARLEEKFDRKVEEKARYLVEEESRKNFLIRLKSEYKDYDDVLTNEAADKLNEVNPEMADMIMKMPDEYQRRKMAYNAIKTLGLHKKAPDTSMQELANQNQRNPYYLPQTSGQGVPSTNMGDFSPTGKKAAYEKMRALMNKPLSSGPTGR